MAALALRELCSARYFLSFNGSRCFRPPLRSQLLSTDTGESQDGPARESASSSESSQKESSQKRNSSGENSSSDKDYDRVIARKILAASLPFVHRSGWTKNAICEGAETLGYAGVVHGMFPRGGVELVNFFNADCNNRLVEMLKMEAETASKDTKKLSPDVVVKAAVEARLRMIVPYLQRWPEALVLLALPHNVPTSIANLLTMVDDICFYAGDRSVDVRWYSRRIGLASVYKMTELYLIQDTSKDHISTWNFLNDRIDEAIQLQRILHEAGFTPKIALETIAATFDTARSILRMNR